MKGLEVNLIWVVVIAVVSIVVLILLTTDTFRTAAYKIYCSLYFTVANFFSSVETSSIPDYCKSDVVSKMQVVKIGDEDSKIFSKRLLSYIIDCWDKAEVEENYKTHTCYELILTKVVDTVDEKAVTDVLIKEDHCKSIENADFGCGVMNQIIWDVGDLVLNEQKIILIEYLQQPEGVRVIA